MMRDAYWYVTAQSCLNSVLMLQFRLLQSVGWWRWWWWDFVQFVIVWGAISICRVSLLARFFFISRCIWAKIQISLCEIVNSLNKLLKWNQWVLALWTKVASKRTHFCLHVSSTTQKKVFDHFATVRTSSVQSNNHSDL